MGTRVYCDNCGCTISGKPPNVLSFGGVRAKLDIEATMREYMQQQRDLLRSQIIGVGQASSMPPPKPSNIPIIDVDLCDTCVPIWMSRVKNLTAQSDGND